MSRVVSRGGNIRLGVPSYQQDKTEEEHSIR